LPYDGEDAGVDLLHRAEGELGCRGRPAGDERDDTGREGGGAGGPEEGAAADVHEGPFWSGEVRYALRFARVGTRSNP
jgi:hypothetical protein